MVKLLLDAGADSKPKNREGDSPLIMAKFAEDKELQAMLRSAPSVQPAKSKAAARKPGANKKPPKPAKASTKRKFFILTYQDRSDLQMLDDYDLADFDDRPLDSGRPLPGPIPKKVKLWVTSGKPSDYLAGPLSWLIFSEGLVQRLWPLIEKSVQVFDAPLRMRKGGRQVTGYKIVNVLSRIAAVARVDGKKTVNLTQLLLIDGSQVPADVHLFRLRESSTVYVASEEFVKLCKGRTIDFFATKTV